MSVKEEAYIEAFFKNHPDKKKGQTYAAWILAGARAEDCGEAKAIRDSMDGAA